MNKHAVKNNLKCNKTHQWKGSRRPRLKSSINQQRKTVAWQTLTMTCTHTDGGLSCHLLYQAGRAGWGQEEEVGSFLSSFQLLRSVWKCQRLRAGSIVPSTQAIHKQTPTLLNPQCTALFLPAQSTWMWQRSEPRSTQARIEMPPHTSMHHLRWMIWEEHFH